MVSFLELESSGGGLTGNKTNLCQKLSINVKLLMLEISVNDLMKSLI